MKFKEPKTIDEQIEYLKQDKRIVFNDISINEAKNVLTKYGYINVISPFKYFFAEKDKNGNVIKENGRHVYNRDVDFFEYYSNYLKERSSYAIIYKNISPLSVGGLDLYCAESNDDDELILYDSDFVPYFRHPWQSYQISGKELILTDDMGEYTYAYVQGEDELMFKNASASGTVMGCGYSLDIYSRVLLSKLTVPMIEEMLSGAEKYIEYAYGGDDSFLTEISSGKRNDFSPLFEKESNIVSKRLLEISDIHIYELRSEGGIPAYEVSVTAYTEIVYTDETGEKRSMQDKYKAAVHFRCAQENYPELVSGKFELDAPKYPAPETEPTTEFFNNYETEPIY